MATNPHVRAELLARLGVTSQRLYQLVKRRKDELPMSTELAIYTLAHEHGIDLSKHLSRDEIGEVRTLVAQLKGMRPSVASATNGGRMARRGKPPSNRPVITIAGIKVESVPGLDPVHAKQAKEMAEKVYPTLYVFENSARDVIARVLEAAYGPEWWTKAVPKDVRERAAKRKGAEQKDAWHGSKRGLREIDYTLLPELARIVRARWEDFKHLFPRQSWFEELVSGDMNVPRRVIAHMHPLDKGDVRMIETAFRKWAKQLKAIEDKLP